MERMQTLVLVALVVANGAHCGLILLGSADKSVSSTWPQRAHVLRGTVAWTAQTKTSIMERTSSSRWPWPHLNAWPVTAMAIKIVNECSSEKDGDRSLESVAACNERTKVVARYTDAALLLLRRELSPGVVVEKLETVLAEWTRPENCTCRWQRFADTSVPGNGHTPVSSHPDGKATVCGEGEAGVVFEIRTSPSQDHLKSSLDAENDSRLYSDAVYPTVKEAVRTMMEKLKTVLNSRSQHVRHAPDLSTHGTTVCVRVYAVYKEHACPIVWDIVCSYHSCTEHGPCMCATDIIEGGTQNCSVPTNLGLRGATHWSAWTAWSRCSETCGKSGLRSRSRTCQKSPNRPDKPFSCHGAVREFERCAERNLCFLVVRSTPAAVTGWSQWGAWGQCDRTCGGGDRWRLRTCEPGKNLCRGRSYEVETCPLVPCHAVWGEWGAWSECAQCTRGAVSSRIRVCPVAGTCSGNRHEARPCDPRICRPVSVWSPWSLWSRCSTTCGEGLISRQRWCNRQGSLPCVGPQHQAQPCQNRACGVQWSQWSQWAPCDATCGRGVTIRRRQCSSPDACLGTGLQSAACGTTMCDTFATAGNWLPWTPWSGCGMRQCRVSGVAEHRQRRCRPGREFTCRGTSVEDRPCNCETVSTNRGTWLGGQRGVRDRPGQGNESQSPQISPGLMTAIILVAVAAIFIGLLIAVVVYKRKSKAKVARQRLQAEMRMNNVTTRRLTRRPALSKAQIRELSLAELSRQSGADRVRVLSTETAQQLASTGGKESRLAVTAMPLPLLNQLSSLLRKGRTQLPDKPPRPQPPPRTHVPPRQLPRPAPRLADEMFDEEQYSSCHGLGRTQQWPTEKAQHRQFGENDEFAPCHGRSPCTHSQTFQAAQRTDSGRCSDTQHSPCNCARREHAQCPDHRQHQTHPGHSACTCSVPCNLEFPFEDRCARSHHRPQRLPPACHGQVSNNMHHSTCLCSAHSSCRH